MINAWLQNLSELLSENLWIGLIISFFAGVLTSFTPCSLSSLPLVIGYVGGYSDNKKKAFVYTLFMALGMSIVFTALGIIAALVGRPFLGMQMYFYIFLGILMAIMALQMWDVIHIFPQKCGYSGVKAKGAVGAVLTGALGGIFASPCSTPVLVAIMAIVSLQGSLVYGVFMLLLYSIGSSILLIVAGTSIGWITEITKNPKFEKASKVIKIIFGIILLLFSAYLFFTAFSGI